MFTRLQDRNTRQNYKSILSIGRIMIGILILGFVTYKIAGIEWQFNEVGIWPGFVEIVIVLLLLMVFNWSLEIFKWRQVLGAKNTSLRKCVRAVLSGLALNWVLPLTSGDIYTKLSSTENKPRATMGLFFTRTVSLLLTSVIGAFSVLFYFGMINWTSVALLGFCWLGLLFLVIKGVFYFSTTASSWTWSVLGLSFLRYAVFTTQFVLCLFYFIPELSIFVLTLGVGWIFLFRTLIPSFFGNFGVREASAFVFFDPFIENLQLVIIPCLIIWLINHVLPTILGTFLLLKIRGNITR